MQWDYSDSVVRHLGVMASDGSGVQDLTPTGSHWVSAPVWSPDGARLAFWDGRASTAGGISVVNADGTGLTTIASEARHTTPAWSPDGQRIVYFRSTDSPRTTSNERGIWSVKPDGTDRIRLRGVSANAGRYDGFQFSPDGTRLVMCRTGQSAATLEVMNADGTALVNLLLGCSPDSGGDGSDSPEWSPDGTRILTTHAYNLWTIAPDGSQATQLTYSGTEHRPDQDGHWSRQGNQIAYSHGNERACDGSYDHELWVMSADGSSKDRLTPCGVDVFWISWGP
jgi:Tol biopolymer transport system component